MKKMGLMLLTLLLMGLGGAIAEEVGEWTVLIYLCGSDLESNYGYATGNLEEILMVDYPDNYLPAMAEDYGVDVGKPEEPGKVSILFETGGAKKWHAGKAGLEVNARQLQRWRYGCYSEGGLDGDGPHDGYELLETLPLQNMADPKTLTDFIRWGVETCPAKKYALVLWGHGSASESVLIDELFDKDRMYLYELSQALEDSGAQLELVLIDACLMASLETAWTLKDSAHWLVASEEIVPGMGTAIGDWLLQLVDNPTCDGEWLGRTICDETLIKYANEDNAQYKSILTWSVIDLTKIDALMDACGRFFNAFNDALRRYPLVANLYARYILEAEEYGDGQDNMRDLASVAYNTEFAHNMDMGLRSDVLQALSEAVVYSVRGPGRSGARGLSFCYPTDYEPEDLDLYAMNFPMPVYLAYLDAISDWEAPDWIYAYTDHVPNVDTIDEFKITVLKKMTERGLPAVDISDSITNIDSVCYRLYRLDEETGRVVRLGRTDCSFETIDDGCDVMYWATDPMHWPSVDGQLFCMDLIQSQAGQKLYDVPVQIDAQLCILRCGRTIIYSEDEEDRFSEYEIYGVWDGFDENNTLLNRSVKPLSALAGQDYRFMFPLDGTGHNGSVNYQLGKMMTMYRALRVEEIPLPPGIYYLEYEVDDMFMRPYLLDRIEFKWDGENMTFPEGFSWEGELSLNKSARAQ